MTNKIPNEIVAKLLVESRNTCNICWEKKDIQIHHIDPRKNGGDNSEENLIVVCLDCHSHIHTTKNLAQNYSVQTLRLYKETWLDLVRKYPTSNDITTKENDISIIEDILRYSDRRSLYFPLEYEIPVSMFDSLSDLRVFIQKKGYRFLKNEVAIESIRQIYKSLVEIEYLFPTDKKDFHSCLFGMLGKEGARLLKLKRQTIIFHLNILSSLIGKNQFFSSNEYDSFGFELKSKNKNKITCFGNFCPKDNKCLDCEFMAECIDKKNKYAT